MLRYIASVVVTLSPVVILNLSWYCLVMSEITPGQIAEAVGKAIPAFFSDAFDQFRQGEGGYLATGEPQGPVAKVGQAVGRAACRQFGSNPVGSSVVNSERFERACRPYLDTLDPGNGAALAPPFQGGQCVTSYLVYATSQGVDLNIGGQTPLNINGPLGSPAFSATVVGSPFPDSTRYQWIFPSDPGKVLQFTARAEFNPDPGFRIDGRTDGQPDNCGNPPFLVIQPDPQTDPTPPPFRFNPDPDVDVGIDVTINPDGSITFDIGPGDITINPFDEGGGGGGGPVEPNPLPPGDQGTPGDPQDTTGGDVEEQDPTRYLVGVLVQTITRPPRVKTRFNATEAYYAGLYYVYIGGDEGLAQMPAALVTQDQFFYAPEGANRFKVAANNGVTLRATPYWRDVVESM